MERIGAHIAMSRKKCSAHHLSTLLILSVESKVRRASNQFVPQPESSDFPPGSLPMARGSRASTSCSSWARRLDAACNDLDLTAGLPIDRDSGVGRSSGLFRLTASSLRHLANQL